MPAVGHCQQMQAGGKETKRVLSILPRHETTLIVSPHRWAGETPANFNLGGVERDLYVPGIVIRAHPLSALFADQAFLSHTTPTTWRGFFRAMFVNLVAT